MPGHYSLDLNPHHSYYTITSPFSTTNASTTATNRLDLPSAETMPTYYPTKGAYCAGDRSAPEPFKGDTPPLTTKAAFHYGSGRTTRSESVVQGEKDKDSGGKKRADEEEGEGKEKKRLRGVKTTRGRVSGGSERALREMREMSE
jgi:hypothetical protein